MATDEARRGARRRAILPVVVAALAASALFAHADGAPARAASTAGGPGFAIDLTDQGLVLLSQRDFRWQDRPVGPTRDVWFGMCGASESLWATFLRYALGDPAQAGGSMPWFATNATWDGHFALEWTPVYIDKYLRIGPNPLSPREPNWGYVTLSGGCPFVARLGALTRLADPVRDPDTHAPITPTGLEITAYGGFHANVVDRNLQTHEPTLVHVRQADGTLHAQLIAGWDAEFGGYLVVDPVWHTGKRALLGGLGEGTERDRYNRWLAAIAYTDDVQPVVQGSSWLWIDDDPEPIELMSIDPSGRRTGFDPATGALVDDDPRASYQVFTSETQLVGTTKAGDPRRSIWIKGPVDGTYGIAVLGTGDGPFTLRFGTTEGDESRLVKSVSGTISKDQVIRYEIGYTRGGTVSVEQVDRFAPRARAGNDFSTVSSQPVQFDGSSSYDVGSSIASYAWDFGDGSNATGAAVTHGYGGPGTYVAKLTVTSARGLTASDTRIVRVFGGSSKSTVRASVTRSGAEVVGDSVHPSLTADGRYVAFESTADVTQDGVSGTPAVFVKDLLTGEVERVSVSSGGEQGDGERPAISADGRFVAFEAAAPNLVAGDTNGVVDVFVRDRVAGTIERISVAPNGGEAGARSALPAITADGRVVVFTSAAANLVAGDTNGIADVFVHDRATGATERVSVSSSGEEQRRGFFDQGRIWGSPAISADGRFVAFSAEASNLVPGDSNGSFDVFVRDLRQQTTERVSLSNDGQQLGDDAFSPSLSADGRFVGFDSEARGVTADDPNDWQDVFVRDRQAASTELISVSTKSVSGDAQSWAGVISRDGRYVAYYSIADDLVSGDTNRQLDGETPRGLDVFLRDRDRRTTERSSVSSVGEQALPNGVGVRDFLALADDGTVAFPASAPNLVANDANSALDVFVRGGAGARLRKPLANLSGPYIGWASSPVRLDASASISLAGGALTATWDFGDGSPQTSGGLVDSHAYAAPGLYAVTVTVSDGAQVSDPATTSVEVLPALGADSLSAAPTCGGPGTQLTLRGLARGANAAVVDGGWDLTAGPLRSKDVEIRLPWGVVFTTPAPATLAFEARVVVPAALTSGSHVISVGAATTTFLTPCPSTGNLRPIADAGGPFYTGGVGNSVRFDGSASRDPDGDALTYDWSFGDGASGTGATPQHAYGQAGQYFVSLVVNDGRQDSGQEAGTHSFARVVVSADDVPPTTSVSREPEANAQGWNRTDVTVHLTATDNPGGSGVKELLYRVSGAQSGAETVAGANASIRIAAEGETSISYFARDGAGNTEAEKTITVRIDRTAPRLACSASPSLLWPPNHRLTPVSVSVDIEDALAGSGAFALVAVTSSEPDEGLGDGDAPRDIQGFATGAPDTSGSLRAERSGKGRGRTYSLSYHGADEAGNTAACTARVTVPHDR